MVWVRVVEGGLRHHRARRPPHRDVLREVLVMHISDVNPKTAATLNVVYLGDDAYHRNIERAAERLYREGNGHLLYVGQNAEGVTIWRDPVSEERIEVLP